MASKLILVEADGEWQHLLGTVLNNQIQSNVELLGLQQMTLEENTAHNNQKLWFKF